MDLWDLREANRARQIEWDADNQITVTYRATELAGELGEACNVIKKLERERLESAARVTPSSTWRKNSPTSSSASI